MSNSDEKLVKEGKGGEKIAPTINKIRVTLTGRNHKSLEKCFLLFQYLSIVHPE
jgi:hypothetical protein